MPVFLAGLDVNHVTGTDLLDLAVPAGDKPDAVSNLQRLALGMVVCQAVRALCANRTWAQPRADCSSGLRMPSICTVPVRQGIKLPESAEIG